MGTHAFSLAEPGARGRSKPRWDRDGPSEEQLGLSGVEAARYLDDVRAFVEVDRDQVREHRPLTLAATDPAAQKAAADALVPRDGWWKRRDPMVEHEQRAVGPPAEARAAQLRRPRHAQGR